VLQLCGYRLRRSGIDPPAIGSHAHARAGGCQQLNDQLDRRRKLAVES
jgi:hypothetical protein